MPATIHLRSLPPESVDAAILNFLLDQGVGRVNAQSWKPIDRHLRQHGIRTRQQAFQHGLLKASREGSVFIGASDRGAARGYFLIQDREDAEVMRQWYRRRIRVEQEHLDRLNALIAQHFPD